MLKPKIVRFDQTLSVYYFKTSLTVTVATTKNISVKTNDQPSLKNQVVNQPSIPEIVTPRERLRQATNSCLYFSPTSFEQLHCQLNGKGPSSSLSVKLSTTPTKSSAPLPLTSQPICSRNSGAGLVRQMIRVALTGPGTLQVDDYSLALDQTQLAFLESERRFLSNFNLNYLPNPRPETDIKGSIKLKNALIFTYMSRPKLNLRKKGASPS